MLGYLVGGFLRLIFRLWTFGLFFFLENRLFLWIKGITAPQLSFKKITPFDSGIMPRKNFGVIDSRFLHDPSHYSWNRIFLSSLRNSKKMPSICTSRTMFALQSSEQSFNSLKRIDNSAQDIWNSQSISIENILGTTNLKTESVFENSCYLISKDILPTDCDKKKENVILVEECIFKDFYTGIVQKEKQIVDLMEPNDIACGSCEKHCSSAGSIDSGFQSFPSVESAYTCIEEEGITLYVSDCRYNKDGKLIYMTVGFGIDEDSSSDDSLTFDSELLERESDSFCENDDESEEFIVFDVDSSCDEPDPCFLFQGTADEISVAMSLNHCHSSSVEIRNTQAKQNFSPCCFSCEDDCSNKVAWSLKNQDAYLSDTEDKNTITQLTNSIYSAGTVPKKKKVQFQVEKNEVHKIVAWSFAYREARKGHRIAADRQQFQRRIHQTAKILEPVLEKKLLQMKYLSYNFNIHHNFCEVK